MQQPDSALATYESMATIIEPGPFGRDFSLPPAYRRLGELYEARGEGKKALEYYGRFVESGRARTRACSRGWRRFASGLRS